MDVRGGEEGMGEERDACLVVESAVARTTLHTRHAVVLPAGISDAALEVPRDDAVISHA